MFVRMENDTKNYAQLLENDTKSLKYCNSLSRKECRRACRFLCQERRGTVSSIVRGRLVMQPLTSLVWEKKRTRKRLTLKEIPATMSNRATSSSSHRCRSSSSFLPPRGCTCWTPTKCPPVRQRVGLRTVCTLVAHVHMLCSVPHICSLLIQSVCAVRKKCVTNYPHILWLS